MLNILIVNYNTQELTDCTIKSINKTTPDTKIYVFDNSDKTPYVNKFSNVVIIDNTKKQYIDFEKFLQKYPNREKSRGYLKGAAPSPKHCISVDKAMDLIGENFILMDSDVIVKKDLHELVDDSCIFVGDVVTQPLTKDVKRVLPFVCYINLKMCKQYGVRYFDENYMHGIYCTKVNPYSDRYDTGAGFFVHASKYKYKKINHTDYVIHYKGGSWDDKATRTAGRYKSPEEFMNKYRMYWSDNNKVIYTCISGPYERLKDPKYVDSDFDYICFTDQPFTSNVWVIKPIPEELKDLTAVKRQRCIKLQPHKYLPGKYDFSVWVDANIEINASVGNFVKEKCQQEDKVLWVGKHPERDCLYREEKACASLKKDSEEIMLPQINEYKKEGFPEHYGLPQTCIMFRKHKDQKCVEFDNLWWEEVKKGSHRDQLSFSYVQWKTGGGGVQYLDPSIFSCPTFRWTKMHLPFRSLDAVRQVNVVYPARKDDRDSIINRARARARAIARTRVIMRSNKNNIMF